MELEAYIDKVEVEMHRWYAVLNISLCNGEQVVKVIGSQFAGEGLGLYDSLEEWEEGL